MDEQLELLDDADLTETTRIEPASRPIPTQDERGVELLLRSTSAAALSQLIQPGGGGAGHPASPLWRRRGGMVGMALGRPIPERVALPQVHSGAAGTSRGLRRGGGCGGSRRWCFQRSEREARESARWAEEDQGGEREPRCGVGPLGRFGESRPAGLNPPLPSAPDLALGKVFF